MRFLMMLSSITILNWTQFIPHCLLTILSISVLLLLFRRFYSAKTSIAVDCWFCSYKNVVDKDCKNCFVCESCDQYNGFSDDGGYNKTIPNHFGSAHLRFRPSPGNFVSHSDILCDSCSLKQNIIVRRLADFEPVYEKHWDAELKAFTNWLERTYPLCKNCSLVTRNRIHEVNLKVLPTFLDWWNGLRSRVLLPVSTSPVAKKISTESFLVRPQLLHFLLRLCGLTCFCITLAGPVVTALTNQHCLVRTRQNLSTFDRIFSSVGSSVTQLHILSLCSSLLTLSHRLSVPMLAQFWFCLLCLLIQLLLIFRHWSHREHPGKRISPRLGPIVLLLDVIVLICLLHHLISLVGPIFFDSTASPNGQFTLRYYGCVILGTVLIPLFVAILLSVKAWFTFCSNDWRAQKRLLTESWPTRYPSSCTFDSTSDRITSRSPSTYSSTNGSRGAYSPSLKQDYSLPDLTQRLNISPSKSLFRPSMLSWPPRADRLHEAMTSVGSSSCTTKYHPVQFHSAANAQDGSECSENSFITSVSRLAAPSHGNTKLFTPHRKHSRSRKHLKHRGLIRFCLSLLFGRVDTLNDVLSELACLLNAMLIGLVIYALGRLFLRLIALF